MTEQEICKRTEDVIQCLYQNREQEGIVRLGEELLPIYQQMVQEIMHGQEEKSALVHIKLLKELVEAYRVKDMLGMADCLKEHAFVLIESYYRKKDREAG